MSTLGEPYHKQSYCSINLLMCAMHRQITHWEKHAKNFSKIREIMDVQYPQDSKQTEYAYEYTHFPHSWQEGILSHACTHLTYPPCVFLDVFTLSIKIDLPYLIPKGFS